MLYAKLGKQCPRGEAYASPNEGQVRVGLYPLNAAVSMWAMSKLSLWILGGL